MEGLKTLAWHWSGQKNEDRHRPRSLGQKKRQRGLHPTSWQWLTYPDKFTPPTPKSVSGRESHVNPNIRAAIPRGAKGNETSVSAAPICYCWYSDNDANTQLGRRRCCLSSGLFSSSPGGGRDSQGWRWPRKNKPSSFWLSKLLSVSKTTRRMFQAVVL